MIIYLGAGLVITLGVFRMISAILGGKKNFSPIGACINVFLFTIAVLMPFQYMIGVVLFGFGVLFMLSICFDAKLWMKLVATAAVFIALIGSKIGISFINLNVEGLALYVIAAFVFFAVSSIAVDIRMLLDKRSTHCQVLDLHVKIEEEKNKLISGFQEEINGIKNYTVQHLNNTLMCLDLYKLADAEASVKDLIERNRTEDTEA